MNLEDFPTASTGSSLLCQVCGTSNPDDQEYCRQCQNKLLILSGPQHEDESLFDPEPEDSFSFDEHLLERISILEEVVKRSAETLHQVLGAVRKQEKNLLVNHTGLTALRELLEQRGILSREEWSELWESRMDEQLQAVQRREHFLLIREHILGLYRGERRYQFSQLLDEAEAALSAYELPPAVAALERAFELDPKNYELACFLGEAYFDQGDQDSALPFFLGALEVKPEHYGALVYGGALFYERGDAESAETLLKQAVDLYPEAFLPHFSLGAVYARTGELKRAAGCLEQAVALDPVPQALYLLGNCRFEMGRPSAAIQHLERAVEGDPAFQEAFRLLGLACLDRGWNRKALAALEKAQELSPRPIDLEALVEVLYGAPPSAAPGVEGSEDPEAPPLARSLALLAQGLWNPALKACRQGIAATPEDPALLVLYAVLNLKLDRYRDVEAAGRRALELTLDSLAAAGARNTGSEGTDTEGSGTDTDVDPGFENSVLLDSGAAVRGRLAEGALTTLVEAARGQGRYREGARMAAELLERSSSNLGRSLALYELAACQTEMEESLDEALAWAQEAAVLAPEPLTAAALSGLGWVHYRRRDWPPAIEALARACELNPTPESLRQLAMALLAAGERDQARVALAQARRLGDEGQQLEQKMVATMRESRRGDPQTTPSGGPGNGSPAPPEAS